MLSLHVSRHRAASCIIIKNYKSTNAQHVIVYYDNCYVNN